MFMCCMVYFQQTGGDEETTPAPIEEETTLVPLILEPESEIYTHWTIDTHALENVVSDKRCFTKQKVKFQLIIQEL